MIRKSIFTTILAMTIALTGCGVGNMMNQGGTSATGSGGGLGVVCWVELLMLTLPADCSTW